MLKGLKSPKVRIRATITLQGYDSVQGFGELLVDDVDDMCKSMQSVTREIAGKYNMPMRARVNMKAMVWWIRDLSARGQSIPDEGFTVDNLEQARSNMQDGKEADDKNPIELPGKFTPRNWVGWWESVKNYLKGQKGATNKPLFYIVRSRNAPMELPDEVTRVAYQMQLAGNQTVYRILKSLTLDTEAYAWVQPSDATSNRRQAALALMDHYDGPAEVLNRYNMAKQELEEAEYQGNEGIYSFSKFSSVLQKAFTTMEQSERPKPQRDQVDELLTRMKVSTNNLYFTQYTNIKMQARRDHGDNFIAAVTFIGSEISENIKARVSDSKGNKQYRSISTSESHRGRGRVLRRTGQRRTWSSKSLWRR